MAKLANFALFQAGWFLAVILQTPWALVWALMFMTIHYRYFVKDASELKVLLIISLVGVCIDTLWQLSPAISYIGEGIVIPYWLVALWLIFPLTLNVSLAWLAKNRLLQVVFGLIGGGGSYLTGAKFGAADFQWWGLALIALAWSAWLPLFYFLLSTPSLRRRTESA